MSWCAENLDKIWDPETVRDYIKLKNYYIYGYSKKFSGAEQKAALEYAEKLANELGAEIEKSGF